MIEVELPDGTVVEFPDGTTPESMQRAVQNHQVNSKATSELGKMSKFRKTLYGAERALDEAAMGLKQIVPKALGGGLSESEREELAVRRSIEDKIPGAWVPRLAGDIALYGGPMAGGAKLAAKAFPKAIKAAGYGAAAAGGAAVGGLQPVLDGESRSENAATGGVFGLAGQAAGGAAGNLMEGVVKKSAAARALPQNVQDAATLGQVADRSTGIGRLIAGVEERIKSIPLVGSGVERARERGVDAWRDEVLKKASPEGFFAPAAPGATFRNRVGDTYDEFRGRYTNALRGHTVNPSQLFEQQVQRITSDPKRGLPKDKMDAIRDQVLNNYGSRFAGPPGGATQQMRGADAKDFESFLSDTARQFRKSDSPMDPNISRVYDDLERAWEIAYKRQLGSGYRKQIEPLDHQYAPFKTVERAAGTLANEAGAFTPAQLTNSVAARTGKARFARGEGMLADDAAHGKTVFQDKLPNSGTADRAMAGGAAAALLVDPLSTAGVALGTKALSLPFTTKAGKNMMTGDTRLQKLLQKLRADDAARATGGVFGVGMQDVIDQESTRY